ncbi:hypothetical protein KW868_01455 [Acinetobacter guillouiae]|uniref:DUF7668 domain-containing protein n=1 Tax=Acinetobacter guillouiae TaxID=106649 RepID=A0A8X8GI50_ACIGI|nr:hypothetical protein [Acinetobacter guillouiae]MCF0263143.1 hypothetical protein [Acinetobacter guillouiae]
MTNENIFLREFPIYKESMIKILMLMISDDYEELVKNKLAYPSTAKEYRVAVNEFAHLSGFVQMTQIPDDVLKDTEVFSLKGDRVNKNIIEVQLWFDDFESDLYAVFCVPINAGKLLHLYDIRVM